MRVTLTLLIAALACAMSSPASSADAQPKEEINPFSKFAPFLADYKQTLLLPTRQDCKNPPVVLRLPTCVIDVDVWLINSGGIDYCLTQMPREVTFDRLTRVVWKLKSHTLHSSATGRDYDIEFHADHGILPHRDKFGQILGGGIGDGVTPNKWWYRRINLYTNPDPAIVYVPMILQVRQGDPDDVGVCAVGDPRIVNE